MYIKKKTVNNINVTEKAFSYSLIKFYFTKQPPIPLLGRLIAAFITIYNNNNNVKDPYIYWNNILVIYGFFFFRII